MRILLSLFSKALVVIGLCVLLYYYPGHVVIDWQNYHFETSLWIFACLLVVGLLGIYYIFTLLRAIIRLPLTIRRAYLRSRHQDAQHTLIKSYLALLLDDVKDAKNLLKHLKYWDNQPLALFLKSELAWRLGERKKALGNAEILKQTKTAPDLAHYLLIRWNEEKGNYMESLDNTQELLQTFPSSPWLLEKAFSLYLRIQQYNELPSLLERMKLEGLLSEDQFKHKRALIFYLQGESLLTSGQHDLALHYLERAHTLAPAHLGITLYLVDRAKDYKNSRWLKRTIEEAWAYTPHPQLFSHYEHLIGNVASEKYIDHILHLTSYVPHHFESYYARAYAYLHAMLWGEARAVLKDMTERWGELPRICRLWAELEYKEFNNVVLQAQWLQRAIDAKNSSAWTCKQCCAPLEQWHPLCPKCHAFDSVGIGLV